VGRLARRLRAGRPCTIILDNYAVHRSKVVKAAAPVLAQAGVTCSFLPPYSPELSQIEPLWHQVKYHDLTQRSFADAQALQDAVDGVLTQRATAFQNAT
jgi:transposase